MSTMLRTPRLLLRPWKRSDLPVFAEMNADPRVMEHFPSLLKKSQSNSLAHKLQHFIEEHGFGLWAVEVPGVAPFIGLIGLNVPSFEAHFTPCVEVGWRLGYPYWGRGYATEGARASLQLGFDRLDLSEIVAMTATHNVRSRHVMEKLGMTRDPADDFEHPKVPEGNHARPHVLYRLTREAWRQGARQERS